MSADLLIAYTRSGGAPPATLESLRVHADGSARAIVTNAWPDGAPQDEAGLTRRRWATTCSPSCARSPPMRSS